MKKLIILLSLIVSTLFSQVYLNIKYNTDPQFKNTPIANINEITFDPLKAKIIFDLKSGGIATENIKEIIEMTFGLYPFGDVSLPVELVNFYVLKRKSIVTLYWRTESESNNKGFDIECMHSDISDWNKVGFIKGKGSTSESTDYIFNHYINKKFDNLKYRLKQLDFDGTFKYSPEIGVTIEEVITPIAYELKNNYPNPFNPTTTISYQIPEEGHTLMLIYDMLGREIAQLVNEQQMPGIYKLDFDGSELGSGIYFCKLISGNYVKTIKMLLVK